MLLLRIMSPYEVPQALNDAMSDAVSGFRQKTAV